MGFSVTMAHAVLAFGLLAGGGAVAGALFATFEATREGHAAGTDDRADEMHTKLVVVEDASSPKYQNGPNRFTVRIENAGPVPVRIEDLTYLVDGVVMTAATIESENVLSQGPTNLLVTGDVLEVRFRPIPNAPTKFKVVTEVGAAAAWSS